MHFTDLSGTEGVSLCVQEGRYKTAVRVDAQEAARHGLQEGALVLESTLAGTPNSSPDASAERQQSPAQNVAVSMLALQQCFAYWPCLQSNCRAVRCFEMMLFVLDVLQDQHL